MIHNNIITRIARLFLLTTIITGVISCNQKELCYHHPHDALVKVNVNWDKFDKEIPTGMSVLIYEQQTDKLVRTVLSNDISHVIAYIPAGNYKTLVYNQSPTEFGSVSFSDMDYWSTAKVNGNKIKSKWYVTSAEEEVVILNPEWVASDGEDNVEVTQEMVDATDQMKFTKNRSKSDMAYEISKLTPRNVIATLNIKIHIDAIYNLRSARASIKGLADGCKLSTRVPNSTKVTQLIENWKVTADPMDPTKGYITASIPCFGLPTGHKGLPEENLFSLDILLVDNKTVMSFPFYVGDEFITGENSEHELNISLNIELELESPLPDVQPEGDSGGGFNASVDNWGDEENIEIPM